MLKPSHSSVLMRAYANLKKSLTFNIDNNAEKILIRRDGIKNVKHIYR